MRINRYGRKQDLLNEMQENNLKQNEIKQWKVRKAITNMTYACAKA